MRANLTATQAMLELARRRDVRRFIFRGSSSAYGNNEKVPFSEADPGAFEIIKLGGNRTTSLSQLIELIRDELGVDPEIQRLPVQPGDVERTYADVKKAARLLGYSPSTPIEEGIPGFTTWLEEHLETTAGTPGSSGS